MGLDPVEQRKQARSARQAHKTTQKTFADCAKAYIEAHSDGDTPHADYTGIRAGSLLRAHGGEWEMFDDVIFATHSDVTLRLLADATGEADRTATQRTRGTRGPAPAAVNWTPSVQAPRPTRWYLWWWR